MAKRVLISAGMIQAARGGVGRYVLEVVAALQRDASDIELFVAGMDRDRKHFPSIDSEHWISIPDSASGGLANFAWHQTGFRKALDRNRIDVVHIPSYRRALWRSSVRQVVTVHDCAPFRMRDRYGAMRGFFGRSVIPPILRRCDAIVAVSRFTAGDLENFMRIPARNIRVVWNGVDHDRFRPREPREVREFLKGRGLERDYLFCLSRLEHPAKNHTRLIDAFERLGDRIGDEVKLVLGGSDWDQADVIHRQIAESSRRENIITLGFISDEEVPLWYAGARAVVLPSLSEGFGLPIVEAMACGIPVTASAIEPFEEIGGGLVRFFDPEDPDAIASAIELTCLLDAGERSLLVEEGMRHAAQFTWHKVSSCLVNVYNS